MNLIIQATSESEAGSRTDLPQTGGDGAVVRGIADEVKQHVARKLGSRIRDLCVECSTGRVILRGRASSYYAKQLAQELASSVLPRPYNLVNQIGVG
jgi:hypothetical protein